METGWCRVAVDAALEWLGSSAPTERDSPGSGAGSEGILGLPVDSQGLSSHVVSHSLRSCGPPVPARGR